MNITVGALYRYYIKVIPKVASAKDICKTEMMDCEMYEAHSKQ